MNWLKNGDSIVMKPEPFFCIAYKILKCNRVFSYIFLLKFKRMICNFICKMFVSKYQQILICNFKLATQLP